MQCDLAQVFQKGERIQGALNDPHTHPTMWFNVGRTVCASSGTCLINTTVVTQPFRFPCGAFLEQFLSCKCNTFSVSGIFHMCNWSEFCLPWIPSPLPYFPPIAYMKESMWCPVCIGHSPKGFHHNRDPAVLCSGAAGCKTTFLDPEELAAYLGLYLETENGIWNCAEPGEVK